MVEGVMEGGGTFRASELPTSHFQNLIILARLSQ